MTRPPSSTYTVTVGGEDRGEVTQHDQRTGEIFRWSYNTGKGQKQATARSIEEMESMIRKALAIGADAVSIERQEDDTA